MGKNRSASGITNVIQYDNNGNITFVSGSTTLMQVSSSGAITTTGVISGSNALSASFSLNSALLNGTGSVGFATTASLLTVSSSQQQISASQQQLSSSFLTLTASFNAVSSSQQQISASLLQVSASYIALSGSYTTFSGSASTRITDNSSSIQQVSSSQQQISSSQQQISSSLLNVISIFATTGSNSFRATQSITGSLTVTGQIIAQTLNVQQVTSSIIYSSGSNNFGCDLNSRQTFTGSVLITGSLTIAGASSATSYSGTTIYGSTAVCSAVGKFSTCIDACSGYFSGNINSLQNLVLTRASTSAGSNIEFRTSSTLNWYIGTRGLVNNNFYIVNEGLTANNLILDASTGAATFACSVQATSLGMNVAPLSDRILYISGNLITTGTSQFQSVMNGTVVNAATSIYGMYVGNNSNVNITNSYAIYLETTGGSGTITNKYGIYQASSGDKNYFAGNVGIGCTSPNRALTVNGCIGMPSTYNWAIVNDNDANWGFRVCTFCGNYSTFLSYAGDAGSDRRGGIYNQNGHWVAYGNCVGHFVVQCNLTVGGSVTATKFNSCSGNISVACNTATLIGSFTGDNGSASMYLIVAAIGGAGTENIAMGILVTISQGGGTAKWALQNNGSQVVLTDPGSNGLVYVTQTKSSSAQTVSYSALRIGPA